MIVSVVLCLLVKNNMFDIEIYSTYYLNRIAEISINKDEFFCYVYFQFLKEYLAFVVLNMTSYRRVGNILFVLYKIVSLVISLGIFVFKFGVLGQLIFLATLFPHSIIVFFFVIFVIKYNSNKSRRYSEMKEIEIKHKELLIIKKRAGVVMVNIVAILFFGFLAFFLLFL